MKGYGYVTFLAILSGYNIAAFLIRDILKAHKTPNKRQDVIIDAGMDGHTIDGHDGGHINNDYTDEHMAYDYSDLEHMNNGKGSHEEEMCFTIPHLQGLKEQFAHYIDKNGDERASRKEISEYLHKYNSQITDEQMDSFIARRDKDGKYVLSSKGDGFVDFIPDYLMEVSSPNYDENAAREWFDLEDSNVDNFVSLDELVRIAVKVGMNPEEAKKVAVGYYMAADQNGDNKLSWEEYKPLFVYMDNTEQEHNETS